MEEKIAVLIAQGNQYAFRGVDLTKVDWFALLQFLQEYSGEEVQEEEELEDGPEGEARSKEIQLCAHETVTLKAARFNVTVPALLG